VAAARRVTKIIFRMRLLRRHLPGCALHATSTAPPGWLERIKAGAGAYASPAGILAKAITALTSVFPIWLQDAQPGQTCHQQKLIGPCITVVHPSSTMDGKRARVPTAVGPAL
jgi:hypothetical protein